MSLSQENQPEAIYKMVKSLTKCEENIDMIVYGIQISVNGKTSEVRDISSDKEKVDHLLHKLIMNEVKPQYLHEFVEDFLFEHYCDFVSAQKS